MRSRMVDAQCGVVDREAIELPAQVEVLSMAIQEILTSSGSVDPVKGNKAQSQEKLPAREKTGTSTEEKADRVDVSEEARALYEAEQFQRLEAIREKIRRDFYRQDEVTEKIVDAVSKEIQGSSLDQ
jgi:hypothetical protein